MQLRVRLRCPAHGLVLSTNLACVTTSCHKSLSCWGSRAHAGWSYGDERRLLQTRESTFCLEFGLRREMSVERRKPNDEVVLPSDAGIGDA